VKRRVLHSSDEKGCVCEKICCAVSLRVVLTVSAR
jgi:hypothetical protein